ncbi:MAG: PEP/pyruvate-binding domain-containing protein, partial [Bacilli bacterium]
EGNAGMKSILGGKGANLAEMTNSGLPVPTGFTISTEACHAYYNHQQSLPESIIAQLDDAIARLEERTEKKLGDLHSPLLVSVRSGSVFSMPGMMDTVLNLGLNDETVVSLAELTGNERFAYDCYRRFIQMFSNVVLGVDHYFFEEILDHYKEDNHITDDPSMTVEDWKMIIIDYKQLVVKKTKHPFPQNPRDQLMGSIHAVFDSWNNQRAVIYRRIHRISDDLGTAVNIQIMVFGNMGDDSGTGVAFTRNPSTGEKQLYGEYLMNAQGEDVVAGIRTPKPISTLADLMPEVFHQFQLICNKLETHYKEMQDIEFTIERGQLYLLQTRNGKRTANAAVKIAHDFEKEGLIDKNTAILRIDPDQLDQLLHRRLDESA